MLGIEPSSQHFPAMEQSVIADSCSWCCQRAQSRAKENRSSLFLMGRERERVITKRTGMEPFFRTSAVMVI
jgi:hypothetical protein